MIRNAIKTALFLSEAGPWWVSLVGGKMFNLLKYLCPTFVRHIMFIIRVTPSLMIIMSLLFMFLLQLKIIEIGK
tara:strand:+ start:177 stop:398 length:222 start_codon:yes stop_codon:yes gene_type:complete